MDIHRSCLVAAGDELAASSSVGAILFGWQRKKQMQAGELSWAGWDVMRDETDTDAL